MMKEHTEWSQQRQEEFEASQEFKDFNKGFNDGYLISRNDPKFVNSLMSRLATNPSSYNNGLIQGKKCHAHEKILKQIKLAKEDKNSSKDFER